MALPPERISVKRRRLDEPVDTLVLEPGSVQDKKRRFTDFIFQRLKSDKPQAQPAPQRATFPERPTQRSQAEYAALGVPLVKATQPGDELRDYARHAGKGAANNSKYAKDSSSPLDQDSASGDALGSKGPNGDAKLAATATATTSTSVDADVDALNGIPIEKIKSARRFHLTRDISSALRPNSSGGIRRRKLNLRPPLATFVERESSPQNIGSQPARSGPVDSIVHVKEETGTTTSQDRDSTHPVVESKTPVKAFSKVTQTINRDGHSIHDDPSTWDVESDQLADELAALAFELDPEASSDTQIEELPDTRPKAKKSEPMVIDNDDDFVFETYIRVRRDADTELAQGHLGHDIGILIINDEDHDLWAKYVREDDDDDDDWDEEDEDSNAEDNPRNDYPEDEVSSDDEFGHRAYKYRQNASDDEQYDNEHDW